VHAVSAVRALLQAVSRWWSSGCLCCGGFDTERASAPSGSTTGRPQPWLGGNPIPSLPLGGVRHSGIGLPHPTTAPGAECGASVLQTRPVPSHDTTGETDTSAAWRGLTLVCIAGVIWGTIGPAVDVVDDRSGLSVWVVGAYRSLAAVAALGLAVLLTRRGRQCRQLLSEHPRRAVGVGVLTATFMVLFFVAVVSVGVSVATVVALGWAPVMLQLVRVARERRPPPASELVTLAAALVGLLLISLAGGGSDAPHPVLGIVTAVASGTAYGLSAELVGPLNEHDGLTVAAVTMTVAAVVLVTTGAFVAGSRGEAVTTTDPVSWLLMVYLGVGTMALAYVLLYAGLRTTPSRTAVVATLLEPVTAVAIAVLVLGEQLTVTGAIGAVLIVAAIASLGLRPAEPAPQ